jgi:hypothetical protein
VGNLRFVTGSTGGVRIATFQGREWMVVPVVALVEGVIQAVNAPGPELVLAEEFGKAPDGWNGRPVMLDHPLLNGERVSANEPKVLEKAGLGQVFHATAEDKKLKMEAWIDLSRSDTVEGGTEMVERLRKGETVEVSVGVFVTEEKKAGTYNGRAYGTIWRDIREDHLALLHEGSQGACSVDMGCGAPRAAEAQEKEKGGNVSKGVKARLLDFLERFRPSQSEEEMSDQDLRSKLELALRATEPGFLGIDAVYPESLEVIYALAPGEEMIYRKRTYSLTDGEVALKDDAIDVRPVMRFEPVTTTTKAAAAATEKEDGMVPAEKTERVKAILTRLAAKTKILSAADVDLVAAWPCERVAALDAAVAELEKEEAVPPPVAAPVDDEDKDAKTPEQTEEEFLAAAPDSIKAIVAEHKAAEAAKRTALISGLKAAQSVYTEDELKAMPTASLEKVSKLAEGAKPKTDFSVKGAPRAAASAEGDHAPEPPDMTKKILAMREARGGHK